MVRFLKQWIVWCVLCTLNACGGGSGSSEQPDALPGQSQPTSGTATLKPSVVVIPNARDAWVTSVNGDSWSLRHDQADIRAGSVLLLDDDCVMVLAVDRTSGTTVIKVEAAKLEQVFSKLDLAQKISLSSATVDRSRSGASASSIKAQAQGLVKPNSTVTLGNFQRIDIDHGPFSGSIEFDLAGDLVYTYDEDSGRGFEGSMNVTGSVTGEVLANFAGGKSASLPEYEVITLVIPLPFTVLDSLLRVVGVRVASIMVPVRVGAEGKLSYDAAIRIKGIAQSNLVMGYTHADGLKANGPTNSASFQVTGEVSAVGPDAAVKVEVSVGPYVRMRPQLLILNQVASLGADLRVGLYADGQISLYLQDPYYCLYIQPTIKTEVSGFFKAVGLEEKKTETLTDSAAIGDPFSSGHCLEKSAITVQSPGVNAEFELKDAFAVMLSVDAATSGVSVKPTGDVAVSFQGQTLSLTLVDGQGGIWVPMLNTGIDQSVNIKYAGDARYADSEFEFVVSITEASLRPKIALTSGSCSVGPTGIRTIELEGTATAEVGTIVNTIPNSMFDSPPRSSQTCGAWTGLYFPSPGDTDLAYCMRRAGDPPTTTWSRTIVGGNLRGGYAGQAPAMASLQVPSSPVPLLQIAGEVLSCPGTRLYP